MIRLICSISKCLEFITFPESMFCLRYELLSQLNNRAKLGGDFKRTEKFLVIIPKSFLLLISCENCFARNSKRRYNCTTSWETIPRLAYNTFKGIYSQHGLVNYSSNILEPSRYLYGQYGLAHHTSDVSSNHKYHIG